MKRIKLFNATLILLFLISKCLTAADWGEGKTKSFKVTAGGLLNVELQSGEIKIQTWEKDEVLIKVEGLSDEAFKYLEMNLKGNELTVRYDSDVDEEDYGVTFTLTVPSKFNLDLKTMGGDVSLKNNITGYVSIDTYGGEISTKNIYGSAKIETKGGDIDVGDVDGDCSINTSGGSITIGTLKGKNVKVNTSGGDINIKKSLAGVSAKTYGGDITVGDLGGDSELTTYGGDISAGFVSGNVSMDTYGGNLDLNGAKGKIKGKTNGGDVNFKKIEGSVDLKTMAGMVSVELSPTPNSESYISTNSGSIELILSSSVKTVVEARIRVQGRWKNANENYKIYSDFNSQSYKADDNARDIIGVYNINGGGSKINLKSVNDDIIIKKGSK